MKKWIVSWALAAAMTAAIGACGGRSSSSTGGSSNPPPSPPAPTGPAQVTGAEYNQLSPLQQYQIANRLLSTLFKGVPAAEFFAKESIGADAGKLAVAPNQSDVLGKIRTALSTPLTNRDAIVYLIEGDPTYGKAPKYTFDTQRKPLQYELAYMYEMPLSDEYFARWMAYKLTNTTLFTPAEELDSVNELNVQKVYEGLVSALMVDTPIRSIVRTHQASQANWRRFRSPEETTRAMIEIFLGLSDRDADVPKASRACKNWLLSSEDEGYELIIGPYVNIETQLILDSYYVTSCEDFYDTIAAHPRLIPQITSIAVEHMFGSEYDASKRAQLVQEIVASEPTTFRQIFLAILFSKEFLMHAERAKWFEETYFNTAARVYWRPYAGFFRDLINNPSNTGITASLPPMYQEAFSLKYGRQTTVPLSALSAAYMHNGMRSALLTRSNAKLPTDPFFDPSVTPSQGWGPELIEAAATMELPDFINYMFISVVGRAAIATEVSILTQVITTARTSTTGSDADCTVEGTAGCLRYDRATNTANRAMVVLDYLSRLPDLYFFTAVQ